MIKLKRIKIKNFMAFGNVEESINLDDPNLILIIGENRDVTINGSFTDSKNGVGKTAIQNSITYAFYDKVIGKIKKDNLVNKFNEKNMVVTLEFEKNSDRYKIVRGRKPNILKFFINDKEYEEKDNDNLAQGENRETQHEIERVIGINFELFKQIITLSNSNPAFLTLGDKSQREIIEELLGITQLSEKAEILKNLLKNTIDEIKSETIRVKTIESLNEKTLLQIKKLEKLSYEWEKHHTSIIKDTGEAIEGLKVLDIKEEIHKHEILKSYNETFSLFTSYKKELSKDEVTLKQLLKKKDEYDKNINKSRTEKICYTCGQEIDDNHVEIFKKIEENLDKVNHEIQEINKEIQKTRDQILILSKTIEDFGDVAEPFYSSEKEAWNHASTIQNLEENLVKEQNQNNPYSGQIKSLKKESLTKIDPEVLEDLQKKRSHQEFLLKILTSKDSFVRKKIIDQSLTFLNYRLDHYLSQIGLRHSVKFMNDLNVSIDHMGREYDFGNLSSGQQTRLILALNWAFRDVFEQLNYPINILFIDELLDSGLDGAGVDASLSILKEMARTTKKTIFLVSHREEIQPRVNKTIKVILENEFSSISDDEEVI